MLTHLSIQGLAIIESLSIDFTSGFNVITGETGAGKSILIKALNLLLGGKASADAVRRGADQASVSGRFFVRLNHPVLSLTKSWGIVADCDNGQSTISIRRTVSAKGRSFAWINDTPVTTGALKEFASTLIDVFGQHDSHRLLDSQSHVHCLDQFVQPRELVLDFHDKYQSASATIHKLRIFVEEAMGKGRDIDYLLFRLSELNEFRPSASDFEAAKSISEHARMASNVTAALQKAQQLLEDEAGVSITRRLKEISRALCHSKSADLEAIAAQAAQIAGDIDDLGFKIGRASSSLELTDDDIDRAESRIAGYQNLFRKHSVQTSEELQGSWNALAEQVAALENSASHVQSLMKTLRSQVEKALISAQKLSKARQKAADEVARRVERELADLAMKSARFSVEFNEAQKSIPGINLLPFGEEVLTEWSAILDDWSGLTDQGSERAEFYLAANKGEVSLPLSKVASGGEVSRIMLALKKALVIGAETCVLVFDEIDTGISGRVADIVGQKIAELAKYCQIICISHLPQVAAYAHNHYVVRKTEGLDRTESTISPVEGQDRLEEIARLLSGDQLTQASMAHAEEA